MTTYSVDLSQGITESLFTDLKNLAGSNVRAGKRLTEITIELFQNIRKHAINRNNSRLVIQKESSVYTIVAVNTVTVKNMTFLQDKIKYINTLDHAQRKEQHTKILGQATLRKKSGAGLGLCRIAMRSASTLVPAFRQTHQRYFTFSLHVTLTA